MLAVIYILFLAMAVLGTFATVNYLAWRSVERDRAAKAKQDGGQS